jgi:hypothetical protein
MEEDREYPSDDSITSIDNFLEAHYCEVGDINFWVVRNTEIRTRWQEENEFTLQLDADMTLREIFGIVINRRERINDGNMWFPSGIMTIVRAFKNRFNMACELVSEAKRATELTQNDERLDWVKTELECVLRMTGLFQDEEGAFKLLHDKTRSQLLEFVKWRESVPR